MNFNFFSEKPPTPPVIPPPAVIEKGNKNIPI